MEFSFDEISLDQQASRKQVEIDLYDELVTITDAEPDEQIRLLAAKPAVAISQEKADEPESIKVTASPRKEQLRANAQAPRAEVVEMHPEIHHAETHEYAALSSAAGSGPLPDAYPKEITPPLPPPPASAVVPPKISQPQAPILPAPTISDAAGRCPDRGQPAGELDMICVECGAFIG